MYPVRVGLLETATGRIGIATALVDVPDMTRSKLALSGLMLVDTPAAGGNVTTEEATDVLTGAKVVQGIRFCRCDQICSYYFRIFRAASVPLDSTLTVQMEVMQGGKPVLRKDNSG